MAEKKTRKPKVEPVKVEFIHAAKYVIVALKSPHLIEGQEYEVTGEIAEILIEKGLAKLK
jgi:hypothetical protein